MTKPFINKKLVSNLRRLKVQTVKALTILRKWDT